MIKSMKKKLLKNKSVHVGTHRHQPVTIMKHVAVHSGCHQSKLIYGSHHALLHE